MVSKDPTTSHATIKILNWGQIPLEGHATPRLTVEEAICGQELKEMAPHESARVVGIALQVLLSQCGGGTASMEEMPEGIVLCGEQSCRLAPFPRILQEECKDGPLPPLFIADAEANVEARLLGTLMAPLMDVVVDEPVEDDELDEKKKARLVREAEIAYQSECIMVLEAKKASDEALKGMEKELGESEIKVLGLRKRLEMLKKEREMLKTVIHGGVTHRIESTSMEYMTKTELFDKEATAEEKVAYFVRLAKTGASRLRSLEMEAKSLSEEVEVLLQDVVILEDKRGELEGVIRVHEREVEAMLELMDAWLVEIGVPVEHHPKIEMPFELETSGGGKDLETLKSSWKVYHERVSDVSVSVLEEKVFLSELGSLSESLLEMETGYGAAIARLRRGLLKVFIMRGRVERGVLVKLLEDAEEQTDRAGRAGLSAACEVLSRVCKRLQKEAERFASADVPEKNNNDHELKEVPFDLTGCILSYTGKGEGRDDKNLKLGDTGLVLQSDNDRDVRLRLSDGTITRHVHASRFEVKVTLKELQAQEKALQQKKLNDLIAANVNTPPTDGRNVGHGEGRDPVWWQDKTTGAPGRYYV